ncbi:Predicted glycosyl transferase [Methylobacterium sp. 275MFSha3.1]|uniref:glycosyltransferase n=1 Tax=Methylobacterium sp. 275MFSha3.1 TaxID=1502746 RepID=UPI0008A7C63B|nr:glycosyltransferase [Methylobacterium sp. 275MFSha3.1]SEH29976.1 Predicted glycosyl transferase [Methylobacterium sp. 275MFSha3.1]
MRVLIAVTHLLGAGHLTRAAAIARAFAAAGHETMLVSGGVPAPMVRHDGLRRVQLPPLRIAGTDFSTLLDPDGSPAGPALLERRRALMVDTLAAFEPDAVITELFPFGRRALAAEFLALVDAARARRPRPLVLASVRDVLVASTKPERIAQAHARVADLYDAVLVHGDPALIPLEASWPLDAATAAKVRYTGYVDEGTVPAPASRRSGVVVAAGSGPAGLVLLRAAAGAARLRPDLGWRILAGHGVPEAELSEIGHGLAPGILGRAQPDYRALLAGAALSVSQCGYNTAVDLLATGTPAVLVPFEAGGETEQRLRAERLAARGLARVLPESELTPGTLVQAIAARGVLPAPGDHGIDRDGAARTVALVESLRGGERSRPVRAKPAEPALDALRRALDAVAARGLRVPLFWRDDDAVAGGPDLDRLIGLAEHHGVPLLLAAIPAGIDASLPRRLEAAAGVSVAVHGLAHHNHAPPGEKRAEFGAHRPLDTLIADAAAGLRIARQRLPEGSLLPVFVPPWNRVAPELAAALPDLGYRGLSAVPGPPIPGLRRLDATLDPIDWRGSRSLRDPEALLRGLAADIAGAPERPLGLLTHHRVHDEAVWDFVGALVANLLRHPAIQVVDVRAHFGASAMDKGPAASKSQVSQIARTG